MEKENPLLLKEFLYRPNYYNAIEIRLYTNASAMFKGAKEWNKENGNHYSIHNDFDALALESSDKISIKGQEYLVFSTLFFHQDKLNFGVISHELNHATFNLFRNVFNFSCKFNRVRGTGYDEEEMFCYIQEDFFKMFLNILKKRNIELKI
jgi:hypothetical protein